jgi:hypothetical protein
MRVPFRSFSLSRPSFRVPFALEIDTVGIVEWLTFRLFHKVIQSHTQKGGKKKKRLKFIYFASFFRMADHRDVL